MNNDKNDKDIKSDDKSLFEDILKECEVIFKDFYNSVIKILKEDNDNMTYDEVNYESNGKS